MLRDADPREITRAGPKLPILVLGLSALIAQWDDFAIGVLLPEIRADLGVDLAFIITLSGVMTFVFHISAPALGFLADRVSRVWLLRIGSLTGNASAMLTATVGSVGGLVGARVGQNVGNAVVEPVGLPLLADYYPSRVRARVFAFLTLAGYVGAIAGPVVAGVLAAAYGWRPTVYALGATAVAVALLTFLLREPVRGYQDRLEMGVAEQDARRAQSPVGWSEGWRTARSVATIRRLWYAAPFLGAIGVAVLTGMLFYYTEEFGVGPTGRGVLSALGFAAGVVALLLFGPWADRMIATKPGRVMTIMGVALVVQAGAFVVLWIAPSLLFAVAVNLLVAAINAAFLPALYTMLSLAIPARIRGLGTMSVRPFYAVGLLAGSVVLALVADAAGLREAMLLFALPSLAAAAILGTGAVGVARDIRAAKAAAIAEEASRDEDGRPLLVCRDVQVEYDGVQVLFGVDLDVAEGEIVALLGTNGAGKSTMLRAIAGVTEPSGGAVFFDGRDITHNPPHRTAERGVVMLPGGRAIFPTMSVEENLRAACWLRGHDPPGIEEILDTFPALRARLDVPAGDLSGGEQQMLALGQAFLMRPRLLMIDELSLGLAPAIVEQLLGILRRVHEQGTTILLVEQSVNLALTIADRALFMEKGRVRYDGAAGELLAHPELVRTVFLGGAVTGADLVSPAERRRRREQAGRRVLEAQGLRVRHGGVLALEDASLHVAEREIVGVIGPNGAGKTTLFDAISGVVPLEAGRVLLDDADVTDLRPDARARLGLVRSFQNVRLFPTMTVREAIAVAFERHLGDERALAALVWAPKLRALERRHARRIDGLLALLGLDRYADRFVGELSTAMRRIVDIACVTAAGPTVLLLDEPSSGLAQAEAEELGPLLRRLVRETGCGLVLIEHDIPLVTAVSDRMIAMDLGRIVTGGDPREVVTHPDVVRAALGGREDVIGRTDYGKA